LAKRKNNSQPTSTNGATVGDTFHNDHFPDLKADFILASPSFTMKIWSGKFLREDERWKYCSPSPESI
jgi:hypothetical protein